MTYTDSFTCISDRYLCGDIFPYISEPMEPTGNPESGAGSWAGAELWAGAGGRSGSEWQLGLCSWCWSGVGSGTRS